LRLPFDLPSCDKFFEIQRLRPNTKAIIFDLDSCLAAANDVGEPLFAPAFAAIRAANDGSVQEEKLRAAFAECLRVAFDAVAD
jgi:putative hydrolase of the HAD superfamily